MIFLDLQPISIVEDIGFSELLAETTDKRYVIPSRKKFTNSILQELYTNASDKLKLEVTNFHSTFKNNCLFGITTDAWTSGSNCSYVTYTLHLVKDYQLISYVISTKDISESHSAVNLRSDLIKTLLDWKIISSPVRSTGGYRGW